MYIPFLPRPGNFLELVVVAPGLVELIDQRQHLGRGAVLCVQDRRMDLFWIHSLHDLVDSTSMVCAICESQAHYLYPYIFLLCKPCLIATTIGIPQADRAGVVPRRHLCHEPATVQSDVITVSVPGLHLITQLALCQLHRRPCLAGISLQALTRPEVSVEAGGWVQKPPLLLSISVARIRFQIVVQAPIPVGQVQKTTGGGSRWCGSGSSCWSSSWRKRWGQRRGQGRG